MQRASRYTKSMKHIPSPASSLLILEKGEELHRSLFEFASEQMLTSAWLAGIGGASSVTLGFYDPSARQYEWKTYSEPLEIVSLTGNLSVVDNEPFWHVHGVFSGKDFTAISGHVKELTIGLTGELHITPLATPITRSYDDTTGLKLICEK